MRIGLGHIAFQSGIVYQHDGIRAVFAQLVGKVRHVMTAEHRGDGGIERLGKLLRLAYQLEGNGCDNALDLLDEHVNAFIFGKF